MDCATNPTYASATWAGLVRIAMYPYATMNVRTVISVWSRENATAQRAGQEIRAQFLCARMSVSTVIVSLPMFAIVSLAG